MQVSIQWLKRYVDITESPRELADMLTILGFEAEDGFDPATIKNVVTAQITSVEKHPNADKLTLCTVFDGEASQQVICGAPNVKKDAMVLLAKVGAVLPGNFVIKKAKIRGSESYGMLCSEKELMLSDEHSGIIILPNDTNPGIPYIEYYNENFASIELDITPNRSDALSHYGIAREIAIKTGRELRPFTSYQPKAIKNPSETIEVVIDDQDGCPRYIAGVVSGLQIGPSPDWMVQCLTSAGQRSINNIVDISNFVLLEMGHPTHLFDFRLIPNKTIGVKRAVKGQKFITLDEVERKLNDEHLLITDGQKAIALAGIMGGQDTAVGGETDTVLIESAYFDPVTIRKGSKSLGMLTEASRRFERGADVEGAMTAFWRIVELLEAYAGGQLISDVVDNYAKEIKPKTIHLRKEKTISVLGIEVSETFISDTLTKLGVEVLSFDSGQWTCIPPSFRPDLEREIDLIEEIARIYGYDIIPTHQHYKALLPEKNPDSLLSLTTLFNMLKGIGFQQCFNNSLQSQAIAGLGGKSTVKTINPLGEQMAVLRTSLFPGLLSNASFNLKNGNKDIMLFEFGQIHEQKGKGIENYFEISLVAGITAGTFKTKDIHNQRLIEQDLYVLKGALEGLFISLVNKKPSFSATQSPAFSHAFSIKINNVSVGTLGAINPSFCKAVDLELNQVFGFELMAEAILQLLDYPRYYRPVSQFPKIIRDLNFILDGNVLTQEITDQIYSKGYEQLIDIKPTNIFTHEIIGKNKKSVVYNLTFQSDTRTLEDTEVNSIINEIISVVESNFDAKLRTQ